MHILKIDKLPNLEKETNYEDILKYLIVDDILNDYQITLSIQIIKLL